MKENQFKKFEPLHNSAKLKIQELIIREGKIINDTKTFVEIQRLNSIAKVDQWGRVDWRAA